MMNPKNMGKMMKQAQQMQKKMGEVQQKLSELEITGIASDGLVKVVMDGKQKVIVIMNQFLYQLLSVFHP